MYIYVMYKCTIYVANNCNFSDAMLINKINKTNNPEHRSSQITLVSMSVLILSEHLGNMHNDVLWVQYLSNALVTT